MKNNKNKKINSNNIKIGKTLVFPIWEEKDYSSKVFEININPSEGEDGLVYDIIYTKNGCRLYYRVSLRNLRRFLNEILK